jgi:hypothetical protein
MWIKSLKKIEVYQQIQIFKYVFWKSLNIII